MEVINGFASREKRFGFVLGKTCLRRESQNCVVWE